MDILTSRSREVAYANCPRLGLLSYDWDGTGLEPVGARLPLVTGIAIHEILAGLLVGRDPNELISKKLAEYAHELSTRSVLNEPGETDFLLEEQSALVRGTIAAWMRIRWPQLREEFEFVAIERELRWKLAPGIIDQVRVDALARRKADGGLFYVEWKTAGEGGDEWVAQWEHNTQILANTLAIEEVLGERVEGVLIEGLMKGRRGIDRNPKSPFYQRRIQQSAVCYGYVHDQAGEYRIDYTRANGWRKIAVWREMPVEEWVRRVMSEDECARMFAPCPPIRANRKQLARWREAAIVQNHERQARLELLREDPARIHLLFPINDDHCFRYWGNPCPFERLCFTEQIERDPLASGLFRRRVNHHAPVEGEEAK